MTLRSQRGTQAPGRLVALPAAVAALLLLAQPQGWPQAAPDPAGTKLAPSRAEREQELEALRAEQRKSTELEGKLKGEIDAIGEDRRKLNQALIDTAARLRAAEERIAASEKRVGALEAQGKTVRQSLASRRAVIAEILATLQRMGRRPPPAILVAPEDALQSVRTAMLLGAVLPEMRADAEALAADLAELARVRRDLTAEREGLDRDVAALSEERQRMTLLVQERQKTQAEKEKALGEERQRAIALGRQADSLKDLISKLEQDATARGKSPAGKAPDARTVVATLSDPGRLSPAIAFAAAKGTLQLPVSGIRLRDYGNPDGLGGTEKGMWIASRSAAQVTAPCDGWVVYAGAFRSYGQLLILNAGGGYHVLLAGMERISVDPGQFVLTGEPVAAMGGGPQSAAAVAIGTNQPVLYVEFRKDGAPVDPSPWWAPIDSEKVRG